VAVLCLRGLGSAAEAESTPVEFQADQAEIAADGETITLNGDVSVRSERFRLRADRLEVRRESGEIELEGDGRVVACPCPSPPVSIGFRRATFSPPGDLVLDDPTLRIGAVPVAWLPHAWLRGPDEWGLLGPRLAWRAEDGAFAGLGVHAPIEGIGAVDLRGGAYVRGGVDLEGRLTTETSSTAVRWDRLGDDLVGVDARGHFGDHPHVALAWDVDALRGGRVAAGPEGLETVSRRYDRLRLGTTYAQGPWVVGVSVNADARRGGAMNELDALGPEFHASVGGAIGDTGVGHAAVAAGTIRDQSGEVLSVLMHQTLVRNHLRMGPLGLRGSAHTASVGTVEESTTRGGQAGGATLALELPMRRTFDYGISHWVSPLIDLGLKLGREQEAPPAWIHGDGATAHGGVGLRTVVGHHPARTGAELKVLGGVIGPQDAPRSASLATATVSFPLGAIGGELGWHPGRVTQDMETVGLVRLGEASGLNVSSRIHGRLGEGAVQARTLDAGGWTSTPVGWMDRPGWSTGAGVSIPWTSWLATTFESDFDIEGRTWLGGRGATAYRHSCACLAIMGLATARHGREGIDAMLLVDLVP
jgi:hypothetical protein